MVKMIKITYAKNKVGGDWSVWIETPFFYIRFGKCCRKWRCFINK